jgi:TPR repeat protein
MYEKGYGVAKDLDKAHQLYLAAAVGGNKPEPFTRVGLMYENGEGVRQDYREAAINYYAGLQFGFFPTTHGDVARCTAIENLLNLYASGRGLPGDQTAVAQQLDEIKQNHPITTARAQYLFGKIYGDGRYVPKDLAEAAAWFHLAADEDFADARQTLVQIESGLSASESASEKRRIEALQSRIQDAKQRNARIESCTDCIWW